MSESEQSGAGRREVAYRLFAAEFDDADFSYSESDEERAPNYVITPTGARVNRLFVVGVLTEVEEVSEDVLRARVVDPTGAFVLYAGQYQPDEQAFLDGARTPMFVALTGKARTFQPDDSDQIFTSVRPESISEVDAQTRDRWTVQTAEQTLDRVGHMATALSLDVRGDDLRMTLEDNGVDDGLAAGIPLAIDHYGTTGAYLSALRDLSLDAARLVAGDIDEVEGLSLAPGDGDDADLSALADSGVEASVSAADVAEAAASPGDAATGADSESETVESTSADAERVTQTGGESEPASTDTADAGATAGTTEENVEPTDQSADTEVIDATETETTDTSTPDAQSTESQSSDTPAADSQTTAAETSETGAVEAPTATAGGTESGTPESATSESETPAADETADSAAEDEDIGDFEPGEFDLDEDEREEIEEEYGTEFQSGTDVPDPGEADIETPDPEELAEAEREQAEAAAADEPAESVADEATEPETTESEPTESDETSADAADPEEDVDLEDATVEVMEEIDDGNGADRETLIETVAERYGASPEDVEDAIQDALMGGRCYEPDDTTVKPI
jgi:RPA family protein